MINPQRTIPQEAFEIHGFSQDFLSDKETFEQIADQLLDFVKDKKIIIHNASFDVSFLNGELKKIKKNLINNDLVIDSLSIARNKFPGSSNSLDSLCKKFNILNQEELKNFNLWNNFNLYNHAKIKVGSIKTIIE